MKACKCGCTEFNCERVATVLENILFDVETEDENVLEDIDIVDTEFPIGPFICRECGEQYAEYKDIPESEDEDND